MWALRLQLLIFFSDNGASVDAGASNHPYRGSKGTPFEGGVKVPAIVAGGRLPAALRGTSTEKVVWVGDLHPTLCQLARCPAAPGLALDGVDVWPALTQAEVPSPRQEVLLMADPFGAGPLGQLLTWGNAKAPRPKHNSKGPRPKCDARAPRMAG